MKQKIDISLELKNELNLIRDTYIAVIENRICQVLCKSAPRMQCKSAPAYDLFLNR